MARKTDAYFDTSALSSPTFSVQRSPSGALIAAALLMSVAIADAAAGESCALPTFVPAPLTAATQNNNDLAVGDWNGDGTPDLAVPGFSNSQDIAILLGLGDGRFGEPVFLPAPAEALAADTGDFNGDGDADIAISGYGEVMLLLGKGDGTFESHSSDDEFLNARNLTIADFNGDDLDDLLFSSDYSFLYLGQTSGELGEPVFPQAWSAYGERESAAGDLDGDGALDIVVHSPFNLYVRLNDGDGNFAPGVPAIFDFAKFPALADLDGDGELDLAATGAMPEVLVALGNGDGTFDPPTTFPALLSGGGAVYLRIGDMDGDGDQDLVVYSHSDQLAALLLNKGNGDFEPQRAIAARGPYSSLRLADLDDSGSLDLAFTKVHGGVAPYLNTCGPILDVDGSGSLQPLTDAILVFRYLAGFRGEALIQEVVDSAGCAHCTFHEIEDRLDAIASKLDVDGNGSAAPLEDGLLILRFAFGFRGDALVAGAVDTDECSRCSAAEIALYLTELVGDPG